jgi:hypothetical protein
MFVGKPDFLLDAIHIAPASSVSPLRMSSANSPAMLMNTSRAADASTIDSLGCTEVRSRHENASAAKRSTLSVGHL